MKKKIGIPLAKYFEQIRQKAKQYGYVLSGEVMIELKNGDFWIYRFNKKENK
ncbi:MAG: hypothetical protein ACFFAU_01440 [Candidatus Hodarchaeota archaeon]